MHQAEKTVDHIAKEMFLLIIRNKIFLSVFFFFCLSFRFSEFCLSVLSCFHLFLPEVPVGSEVDGMNILAWWCLPSSLVWPCGSWALRESCSSASSAPSVMHPSAGLLDHVGKW